MKKQLLLLAAACLLVFSSVLAQSPKPVFKVGKAMTPPEEDEEIVFEIPDGETSLYSRNCVSFKNDYYEGVSKSDIKGSLVKQVYVAEDGNVWLSNPLSDFMMLSYVKAHFDNEGSIVIEGPQFIYDEYDDWNDEMVKIYLVPMVMVTDELGATYVAADDMKYVLKKTENGYEAADPDMLLGLATYGELVDNNGNLTGEMGYAWLGYGDKSITMESRPMTNGVNPPEGTAIERWVFKDPYEEALVNVAVDGNSIYIQGLDRGMGVRDAWVKADVSGDKATIPSGAYLGYNEDIAFFSYLWGANLEDDEENDDLRGSASDQVVFTYNSDEKTLKLQDGYAISSMPEDYFLLTLYKDVSIFKQNRNINTPPATPTDLEVIPYDDYWECGTIAFNLPSCDIEGNILDTDKLYYRIYIDNKPFEFKPEDYPYLELTENMVNVPYSLYDNDMIYMAGHYHLVYFNFELPENGCGVQAVYINEEGKELCSDIATVEGDGIDKNVTDRKVVSQSFYNLQGQRVPASYSGAKITKTLYDDGTTQVKKSLNVRR